MAVQIELGEGDYGDIIARSVGEVSMQVAEIRKASKTHKCSECGENIYYGENYMHFAWKDDDGFHYLKKHRPDECAL